MRTLVTRKLLVSLPALLLAVGSGAVIYSGLPLPTTVVETMEPGAGWLWLCLLFTGSLALVFGPWLKGFRALTRRHTYGLAMETYGAGFAGGMPIIYGAVLWTAKGINSGSFLAGIFMFTLGILFLAIGVCAVFDDLEETGVSGA